MKTCVGFFAVLVAPSPKSHCQEVGSPGVVSANITDCPTAGEVGLNTKDAVDGAGMIAIVLIVLFETDPFTAVNVTR